MYRHTQVGWWMLIVLGGAVGIALAVGWSTEFASILGITGLAVLPIVATFASMTVTVDDTDVVIRFGVGLLRKRVALSDVIEANATRTNWLDGIGIRMVTNGWLYNVATGDAVELKLASGSRVLIGSNDAAALHSAIEAARAAIASPARSATGDTTAGPGSKWILAIIVPILLAVSASIYYQARSMDVDVAASGITIRSGFYSATIKLDELREVIVADSLPRLRRRTNGFAFGDARRGHFTVDSLGPAMLFVTLDAPPYVVLKTADKTVIVSFRDPQKAKVLVTNLSRLSGN